VTQRRNPTGGPKDLLTAAGSWPDEPTVSDGVAPGVAAAAKAAAAIAERLERELRGRNIAAIARDANVARSTIYDIVAGTTWPDIVTIFKLQDTLGVRLWGLK
jgi:hypothetical protein